jgi:hypothetical protein
MPFDAETFAKMVARFDTCNPSEAEAMGAARALRRMVVAENLRIVDVLGRADVIAALDAQLQPVREDPPELRAAFLEIARLADVAKEQAELIDQLRRRATAGGHPYPVRMVVGAGMVNGYLFAAVLVIALTLMIAAAFR